MNSLDDPFLEVSSFPSSSEVSPQVQLEYHRKGGHAAFITGPPWNKSGWTETRVPEFFKTH
jgi:predicted alpha/beta-fold hydrolase